MSNNEIFSIDVYEGNSFHLQTEDGEVIVPTFWILATVNNLDYIFQQSFRFYSDAIDKSEELYDSIIDLDDWDLFEPDVYDRHCMFLMKNVLFHFN